MENHILKRLKSLTTRLFLYSLSRLTTAKLLITGLCEMKSSVTGRFLLQRANSANSLLMSRYYVYHIHFSTINHSLHNKTVNHLILSHSKAYRDSTLTKQKRNAYIHGRNSLMFAILQELLHIYQMETSDLHFPNLRVPA